MLFKACPYLGILQKKINMAVNQNLRVKMLVNQSLMEIISMLADTERFCTFAVFNHFSIH